MEGKIEFALAATDEYIEGHVLGLDLITVGKLQAGRYSPEAHLDLHGLNAVQAFQTLVGFIKGAYLKGQRTLLVVPGRGRNSPHGMPILRTKVQEWLTQEPFRRVVLAFCTARPADGGLEHFMCSCERTERITAKYTGIESRPIRICFRGSPH